MRKLLLKKASVCLFMFGFNLSFAAEYVIVQENEQFSELFLKVESKDVVKFVNNDVINHQLTFRHKNLDPLTREMVPGSSQAVQFSKPGVYDVQCEFHPEMKLTVFVPHVDVVLND